MKTKEQELNIFLLLYNLDRAPAHVMKICALKTLINLRKYPNYWSFYSVYQIVSEFHSHKTPLSEIKKNFCNALFNAFPSFKFRKAKGSCNIQLQSKRTCTKSKVKQLTVHHLISKNSQQILLLYLISPCTEHTRFRMQLS